MRQLLFGIFAVALSLGGYAQPGTITNIQVSQRPDGTGVVDIYFDLNGSGSAYNIEAEISFDGGSSYISIPGNYLSGHVSGVSLGGDKHIIWDGIGSFPNRYNTQPRIRIIATQVDYTPTAAFTGTPTSGTAPLTVSFTDQSTNDPTNWSWDFGDGTISTQRNPTKTYDDPGTYTVALTSSNSFGSNTSTKNNYITASGTPPVANFVGSPTSGTAPLTVSFTDQSTNNPTSWSWSFGDGTTSTQRNPSKTFNNPGVYNVSHTASNSHGSNTHTKNSYITVSGTSPVANFSGSPTSGTAPLTVSFTDQSTNDPTNWSWDFGDGTISTQRNPTKTYDDPGTYTVALTSSNSFGSNTNTKNNYITVNQGDSGDWPRDTETQVVDVTNPKTGKTWMDRNLGASRAATSSTDAQADGDLYQWGRAADGHQKRSSGTTSTLSSSDTPGHGNFIMAPKSPDDWRSPQNINLWQGSNGINNPCPPGYRLPTNVELEAERKSWSSNNSDGAFASPLKLSVAGSRWGAYSWILGVGYYGHYWSSTVDGTYSQILYFYPTDVVMGGAYRADGFSVRCLKDN